MTENGGNRRRAGFLLRRSPQCGFPEFRAGQTLLTVIYVCPPVGTDAVGKRWLATSGKAWWEPPRLHVSGAAVGNWLVKNIEPVFGALARESGWRRGRGYSTWLLLCFLTLCFEKGYAGGGLCRRFLLRGVLRYRSQELMESETSWTRCLISFTYMCQPHGRVKARQCVPCDLGDGILSFMSGPPGSGMEQKLESLILAQNERWRHA